MTVKIVGLDLAKDVFQVHCVSATGRKTINQKIKRADAADAEAISEAVRRPTMRFVEIKSEDQQAVLSIHRARDLVVRQRTQVVNMIRSILREFGHI